MCEIGIDGYTGIRTGDSECKPHANIATIEQSVGTQLRNKHAEILVRENCRGRQVPVSVVTYLHVAVRAHLADET